jgi:hypothetical protein
VKHFSYYIDERKLPHHQFVPDVSGHADDPHGVRVIRSNEFTIRIIARRLSVVTVS